VRIDPAHSGEPVSPAENRPGVSPSALPARKAQTEAAVDSSQVLSDIQPYVRQAAEAPEVDLEAVEQAQALLKAGQLDTPEALERLARTLLDRGA